VRLRFVRGFVLVIMLLFGLGHEHHLVIVFLIGLGERNERDFNNY
jgi:hypothetical protein